LREAVAEKARDERGVVQHEIASQCVVGVGGLCEQQRERRGSRSIGAALVELLRPGKKS
jgi:hypothetical protein